MIALFSEIKPSQVRDNFTDIISNEWALLTAGDASGYNTMTVSWGFAGEIWGNDAVCVFVRPQRYTYGFMEKSDYFTLSFYGDNKKLHSVCGSKSGRDTDKAKECGLTPVFDGKATYFDSARLVFICKKLYADDIKGECFTDKEPLKNYADNDFHRFYIGKIIKVIDSRNSG